MRPEMSHDVAWASLGVGALNVLPAEEHEALLAHARTCATCGPELAALSDAAAQLEHADSPPDWDDLRRARLRRRLLARVAADAGRVELGPAEAETARPAVPTLQLAGVGVLSNGLPVPGRSRSSPPRCYIASRCGNPSVTRLS